MVKYGGFGKITEEVPLYYGDPDPSDIMLPCSLTFPSEREASARLIASNRAETLLVRVKCTFMLVPWKSV